MFNEEDICTGLEVKQLEMGRRIHIKFFGLPGCTGPSLNLPQSLAVELFLQLSVALGVDLHRITEEEIKQLVQKMVS